MNKYIKPTITLLNAGTTTAAASTCSTSTTDANAVLDILEEMGYNKDQAFEPGACNEPVVWEDYCKFSSGIQIFNS